MREKDILGVVLAARHNVKYLETLARALNPLDDEQLDEIIGQARALAVHAEAIESLALQIMHPPEEIPDYLKPLVPWEVFQQIQNGTRGE